MVSVPKISNISLQYYDGSTLFPISKYLLSKLISYTDCRVVQNSQLPPLPRQYRLCSKYKMKYVISAKAARKLKNMLFILYSLEHTWRKKSYNTLIYCM